MAKLLSELFGAFKTQHLNTQNMLGSMDAWAGRVAGRAMSRGSVTRRALTSSMASRGAMGTFNVLRPGMQSAAMRGAMWGAGLGAGASVLGDTMSGNLNGGSFGRAIGGGFRGGLMGGFGGAAMGMFRPSMRTVGRLNRFGARSTARRYRNMMQ